MDWKKEKDYEYTNDLSPEGWAWEFLRRNQDYIKFYKEFRSIISDLESKYGKRKDNPKKWAKYPDSKVYIPALEENESEQQWKGRVMLTHDNPRIINIESYYAEKWELQRMYDPTEKYSEKIQFKLIKEYPRILGLQEGLDYFSHLNKVHSIPLSFTSPKKVLVFDLSKSIPDQLNIAKKHLVSAQKHHFPKGNLPRYLRVLDGFIVGAKSKEIREVIFAALINGQMTNDDLARKLRDNKNRAIELSYRHLDLLAYLKLKSKAVSK